MAIPPELTDPSSPRYEPTLDPNNPAYDEGNARLELWARTFGQWLERHWLDCLVWAACALLVFRFLNALFWPFAGAAVLLVLGWHYRNSAALGWLRAILWDAFLARLFGKIADYTHGFQKAAHEQQLKDTQGELKRMAFFGDAGTQEAAVFLSQARPAMEERLASLLEIPKPTPAQHQERVALEKWIKEDRQRAGALADSAFVQAPRGFLGPIASVAGGALVKWLALACGGLVVVSGGLFVRGEMFKAQREAAEQELSAVSMERDAARAQLSATRADLENVRQGRIEDALNFSDAARRNADLVERRERRLRAQAERERTIYEEARNRELGAVVDRTERLRQLESLTGGGADDRTGGSGGADADLLSGMPPEDAGDAALPAAVNRRSQ